MTSGSNPSLLTLPLELVCRVLDHLNPLDILLSIRDVCTRLDAISDTYYPYQVRCSHPLTHHPSSPVDRLIQLSRWNPPTASLPRSNGLLMHFTGTR